MAWRHLARDSGGVVNGDPDFTRNALLMLTAPNLLWGSCMPAGDSLASLLPGTPSPPHFARVG